MRILVALLIVNELYLYAEMLLKRLLTILLGHARLFIFANTDEKHRKKTTKIRKTKL